MLYLLCRIGPIGYDEYDAKVVRAASKREARETANQNVGEEGAIWLDTAKVSCRVVDAKGQPKVILSSFNAG